MTRRGRKSDFGKVFKYHSVRGAIKERLDSRVGDHVVYECMEALEEYLEKISILARENLDEENVVRKERGVPCRRTIHSSDIKKAIEKLGRGS
ncbi:MAG: hypothetical protein JXA22_02065 [Candidatus Thermoplasmatota archaeon]|nr:hypothetical protein [Candidatus Thermoplasmatota archaeon]